MLIQKSALDMKLQFLLQKKIRQEHFTESFFWDAKFILLIKWYILFPLVKSGILSNSIGKGSCLAVWIEVQNFFILQFHWYSDHPYI